MQQAQKVTFTVNELTFTFDDTTSAIQAAKDLYNEAEDKTNLLFLKVMVGNATLKEPLNNCYIWKFFRFLEKI